ncbi:MAG: hypothetical protein H0V82_10175 [Candidatus Protochlamydia sp.]|nr:hypothetical protein [Candidatus Protochlamydia sp.]
MNAFSSIIHEDSNNFHAFIPPSNQIYGGDQITFRLSMKKASYQISEEIGKCNFFSILEKTGKLRQNIAIEANTLYANKFGNLRNPNRHYDDRIATPLNGAYSSMISPLMQINENDLFMNWETYAKKEEGGGRTGFRVGVDKNSQSIELSRYILYPGSRTIAHTYPENLGLTLQQCEFLYNNLVKLNSNIDSELIDKTLARLHWWFIQATPYFRGTASCGEIISSAITHHKYGKLIEWEQDVHVDHIALVSSEEEFVSIYPHLYKLN